MKELESNEFGEDKEFEEVSVWGSKEVEKNNTKSSSDLTPIHNKKIPSVWHILAGFAGLILVTVAELAFAIFYAIRQDPNLVNDTYKLQERITSLLTQNIFGLGMTLILTWVALTTPIFWASRNFPGGFKKMIGWQFNWRVDLKIAVAFALGARLLEFVENSVLKLFHIDGEKLTNGGLLTSAGSKWIPLLVVGASIGAPIAEELFFRGMVLKVTARRFGKVVGIIVSSVLFGLTHAQGSLAGTIYMTLSTAIIGAGLGILVLKTNRLGTSILSHGAFNASAGLFALLGI